MISWSQITKRGYRVKLMSWVIESGLTQDNLVPRTSGIRFWTFSDCLIMAWLENSLPRVTEFKIPRYVFRTYWRLNQSLKVSCWSLNSCSAGGNITPPRSRIFFISNKTIGYMSTKLTVLYRASILRLLPQCHKQSSRFPQGKKGILVTSCSANLGQKRSKVWKLQECTV